MVLDDIINALNKVDVNKLGKFVFVQADVQKWILDTIRNRLEKTGIAGDGKELKTDNATGGDPYSFATMDIKSHLGQTISHVTLKDTGKFYSTFKTILKSTYLEIDANFIKGTEHIGRNFLDSYTRAEFYQVITKLTDAEMEQLFNQFVIDRTIKYFNQVAESI
jgi:hypothetical protein